MVIGAWLISIISSSPQGVIFRFVGHHHQTYNRWTFLYYQIKAFSNKKTFYNKLKLLSFKKHFAENFIFSYSELYIADNWILSYSESVGTQKELFTSAQMWIFSRVLLRGEKEVTARLSSCSLVACPPLLLLISTTLSSIARWGHWRVYFTFNCQCNTRNRKHFDQNQYNTIKKSKKQSFKTIEKLTGISPMHRKQWCPDRGFNDKRHDAESF